MAMSPRLLRPRATGFDPRSVSGLVLWLDAADSSTVTLGTGVSSWRDKSANALSFTQGTGNNQPAYASGAVGGKSAILFDGANDQLTVSGVTNSTVFGSSGGSVFVVYRPATTDTYTVFFQGGDTNGRDRFSDNATYNSIFRSTRFEGVAYLSLPKTPITTIYATTSSVGGNHVMRSNGVVKYTTTSDFTAYAARTSQLWRVGNGPQLDYYTGYVCEIVGYSRALSSTEIATVEKGLAAKWQVTL